MDWKPQNVRTLYSLYSCTSSLPPESLSSLTTQGLGSLPNDPLPFAPSPHWNAGSDQLSVCETHRLVPRHSTDLERGVAKRRRKNRKREKGHKWGRIPEPIRLNYGERDSLEHLRQLLCNNSSPLSTPNHGAHGELFNSGPPTRYLKKYDDTFTPHPNYKVWSSVAVYHGSLHQRLPPKEIRRAPKTFKLDPDVLPTTCNRTLT